MKKLLTLSFSLLFVLGANAQEQEKSLKKAAPGMYNPEVNPVSKPKATDPYFSPGSQKPRPKQVAREPFSASYNLAFSLSDQLPSAEVVTGYIHPDSALLEFNNGFSGNFRHAVGMAFNPGEDLVNRLSGSNEQPILRYFNSYNFDSVTFPYFYNRGVDSFIDTSSTGGDDAGVKKEVVDTLIIQYKVAERYASWGEPMSQNDAYPSTGRFADDTIRLTQVDANYRTLNMTEPLGEVRVPLDGDDANSAYVQGNDPATVTANVDAEVQAPPLTQSLREPLSVVATATFKPGYPVNGRDTLRTIEGESLNTINNHIAFSLVTLETSSPALLNESYTNAMAILNNQRYGEDISGVYSQRNFPFGDLPDNSSNLTAIYYDMTFHLSADETDNLDSTISNPDPPDTTNPDPPDTTDPGGGDPSDTTGLENANKGNIGLVANTYPNPAENGDQIRVSLGSKVSVEADVRLYNTIGKAVENYGTYQIRGGQNTSLQINTDDLQPGIYFLNVETPKGRTTEKISIVR